MGRKVWVVEDILGRQSDMSDAMESGTCVKFNKRIGQ